MTQASTTGPVQGEMLGRPERIVVHWTAGDYEDTYPHYHFCTRGDGRIVPTLSLKRKGSHTWGRNTGAVGMAMCGGGREYPIRLLQTERTAKLIAECSIKLAIPLHGQVELPQYRYVPGPKGRPDLDRLVPTGKTIIVPAITDHRFYAIADGYYPHRVDVGDKMMDALLDKAEWYADKLKKGLKPFEWVK